MMASSPTFIIADNQDITRAGLRAYISRIFKVSHVVEVACKRDLITELDKCGDGVVIIDYTLFDLRGIEDFLILHRRFPTVVWLMFSTELSEDFIRRVSAEDNVGVVLKDNSGEEIRSALLCAAAGERFLCHQVSNMLLTARERNDVENVLTPTEIEILKLIAKGLSVKEMALERVSSVHTVITHKKNIFRKLGVNNVYEATKYALRAGLVEMLEYYI